LLDRYEGQEGKFCHPNVGKSKAVVKPLHHAAHEPFRTAFCRTFNLSDERFEVVVLRRCFPWWSRALGAVVLALRSGMFQREFRVIAQLGRATHPSQFGPEFEAYVYETVRDKAHFRTRTLGLRLSRRLFERLAVQVWRQSWGENKASAPVEAAEGEGEGVARTEESAGIKRTG